MKFYGTEDSIRSWKEIVENCTGRECSAVTEVEEVEGRFQFSADLTEDDRNVLHDEYWYEVAEGHDLPWNYRITFSG